MPRTSWTALSLIATLLSISFPLSSDGRPPSRPGRIHLATGPRSDRPAIYEPNVGQADPSVRFVAHAPGHTMWLIPGGPVFAFGDVMGPGDATARDVLRMQFAGGDADAKITGEAVLPGKVNYLTGSDPDAWRTNVSTYSRVRYESVYPGIDVVFHGSSNALEYDFVIAPGADPGAIALEFDGAGSVGVDDAGALVIAMPSGEMRHSTPVVYQESGGAKRGVASRFVAASGRVEFELGEFDPALPLVIDPVITYAGVFGGSNNRFAEDVMTAMAADAEGNVFVAGYTQGRGFPGAVAGSAFGGFIDAIVSKISPAGALLYTVYLGGATYDAAAALATDPSGDVYVVGNTSSTGFPTLAAFQPVHAGAQDAFVVKLDGQTGAIVYSSFLGGSGSTEMTAIDEGTGVAVGADGAAYVVGSTQSAAFPVTSSYDTSHNGETDAFLVRVAASGGSLDFSTFLGSGLGDNAADVKVDAAGAVYVTGRTASASFPTVSAFDSTPNGGVDAFVAKFSASGSALVYSTYLGSAESDAALSIALDASGAAYVLGTTNGSDFPTAAAYDWGLNGFTDLFVTKLHPSGSSLVYSTYLGGAYDERGGRIALGADGTAYVVGGTASTNFPTIAALDSTMSGLSDAFVARFSAAGSSLLSSTFFGGSSYEDGRGMAVDASGAVVITGFTDSLDLPLVNPAQEYPGGGREGFVTRIAPGGLSIEFSTYLGSGDSGIGDEQPARLVVDAVGNMFIAGSTNSADMPAAPAPGPPVAYEAFVTKLDPTGATALFTSYFGGSSTDYGRGLAVDATGSIYLAGVTYSNDLPTVDAFDAMLNGTTDAWVAKLDASGAAVLYATYIGGSGGDDAKGVAVDPAGAALLVGVTSSGDFPLENPIFSTVPCVCDAGFATKLAPSGEALMYSTFLDRPETLVRPNDIELTPTGEAVIAGRLVDTVAPIDHQAFVMKLAATGASVLGSRDIGGSLGDEAFAVAVDGDGNVLVAGSTSSTNFPLLNPADTQNDGLPEAFAVKFAPDLGTMLFSTIYGGASAELAYAVAAGPDGSVYVGGYTSSLDFRAVNSQQPAPTGEDAFVIKFGPDGGPAVYAVLIGGPSHEMIVDLAVDSAGAATAIGRIFAGPFPTSPGAISTPLAGTSVFVVKLSPSAGGGDSPGVYFAESGLWALRNSNSPGPGDAFFGYGLAASGWQPVEGDWNGDGRDTPGFYNAVLGEFYLRNQAAGGGADVVFGYGPGNAGWQPLVGDWDGDGVDSVGLYEPVSGTFFLRNTNAAGPADVVFGYGPGGAGWVPIAGDWDGDGFDSIGLYVPATGFFYLRNANAAGPADLGYGFGPGGAGWMPLAGDWNDDGVDSAGLYEPSTGFFYLRNEHASGPADAFFGYGPPNATPLAGDWDGQ